MADAVYTLTAHDTGYPGAPDQVVGLFGDAELAMKAANEHWDGFTAARKTRLGLATTPLEFTSHNSENTGHDFHVATGDFWLSDRKVTYSVNGFTVKRA